MTFDRDEYGMCSGCFVLYGPTEHDCYAARNGWQHVQPDWWLLEMRAVDFHPSWFAVGSLYD